MFKPAYYLPFLGSLLFSSCAGLSSFPKPQESQYIHEVSGGTQISRNGSKPFQNHLNFKVKQTAPALTYATVQYQALDGSATVSSATKNAIRPGQTVTTSSESYGRIRNNTNYNVTVLLYSDSARKNQIDILLQPIRFSMPPEVLDSLGLKSRVD